MLWSKSCFCHTSTNYNCLIHWEQVNGTVNKCKWYRSHSREHFPWQCKADLIYCNQKTSCVYFFGFWPGVSVPFWFNVLMVVTSVFRCICYDCVCCRKLRHFIFWGFVHGDGVFLLLLNLTGCRQSPLLGLHFLLCFLMYWLGLSRLLWCGSCRVGVLRIYKLRFPLRWGTADS